MPVWGQALGWLLVWPLLLALLLAGGSTRSTGRSVAAAMVLLVAAPVWAGVLLGDSTPQQPDEVVAEERPSPAPERAAPTSEPAAVEDSAPSEPAAEQEREAAARPARAAPRPQPSEPPAEPQRSSSEWRVVRVIDGDTVDVVSAAGVEERVRVIGIDTPERGECGFGKAASALSKLVLDKDVDLRPGAVDDRDRYGRILRYVDVDGTDAGLRLIKRRLAVARYDSRDGYGRHPREDRYVAADTATRHVCTAKAAQPVAPPAPPAPAADLSGGGAFSNCTEARAAGAAPVHRGDPGYGSHLDRDGDGVGCE